MTTRVQSVSIPVADRDRALAFYTEVLGCELRTDDSAVDPGEAQAPSRRRRRRPVGHAIDRFY